jgi:hypothetical protein
MTKAADLSALGSNVTTAGNLSSASTLTLQTNSTTAVTIDTSQNVGIGTTSPAVKLDIIGSSGQNLRLRNGTVATEYYDIGRDGADGLLAFNGAQSSPYVGYKWSTTGTERMRIDSSGNVGIGTTSAATKLQVEFSSAGTTIAGSPVFTLKNTSFTNSCVTGVVAQNSAGGNAAGIDFINVNQVTDGGGASGSIGLWTNSSGTKGYRIYADNSGNVLVGTTSAVASTRMSVERINGSGNEATIGFTSSGVAKWKIGNNAPDSFVVYTPSNVGVYINAGATSWTATSDERLKNITGNIENALDAVQTLRAVKFTWIADEENKSQVGLIAQDVQAVLPEIISEDAEGYLGIRYTETIPLLVAAIQEQQTIINDLKARVETLEAK